MILLDTNILYHILHKTSLTEEALTLLDDNPGEYVIDTIVHNELIYTSTLPPPRAQARRQGSLLCQEMDKETRLPEGGHTSCRRGNQKARHKTSPKHLYREGALRGTTQIQTTTQRRSNSLDLQALWHLSLIHI